MDLSNPAQLKLLKEIGISVSTAGDGKILMTHNPHLVCTMYMYSTCVYLLSKSIDMLVCMS